MKTLILRSELELLSDDILDSLSTDICGGIYEFRAFSREKKLRLLMQEDYQFAINLENLIDYLQPKIVDMHQLQNLHSSEFDNNWEVRYVKSKTPTLISKLFHGKELFDVLMNVYLYHKERALFHS